MPDKFTRRIFYSEVLGAKWKIFSILSIIVLTGSLLSGTLIQAAYADSVTYNPHSNVKGLTYGEWSAKWWQWAISLPKHGNPISDPTGKHCADGQSGPVWYLAGTFGSKPITRECTVPHDKVLMLPVVNAICWEDRQTKTEAEVRAVCKDLIDHTTVVDASVDGVPIDNLQNYRMQSPLFDIKAPDHNILRVKALDTQGITDGYWVMLKPLKMGSHQVHFHAILSFPDDGFTAEFDITYNLKIVRS